MENKRWDIVHETLYGLCQWVGVISNGKNYKFFRTEKENDRCMCYVFDTLADMMGNNKEHAIVSYLWTSMNDTLLMDALTDGTPLGKINFSDDYEE